MTDTALSNVTASVVRSLVLYSLAEYQLGHVCELRVSASGHGFSIEDDGRGHAISRRVDGAPYLDFIYGQLDYPFGRAESKTIQLQGIGMSLLNSLCAELAVTVRKRDATLRLDFRAGRLREHRFSEQGSERTGNAISGRVDERVEARLVDEPALRDWLCAVQAASPGLAIHFNGQVLNPA